MLLTIGLLVALLILGYQYYRLYRKHEPFKDFAPPTFLVGTTAYGPGFKNVTQHLQNICARHFFVDVDITKPDGYVNPVYKFIREQDQTDLQRQ